MKECFCCGHSAEYGFVTTCDKCDANIQKETDKIIKKLERQELLLKEIFTTIDPIKYKSIINKIKKLKINGVE